MNAYSLDTLLIIIEQCLMHVPLLFGAYITISLMKLPDLSIESAYVSGAITGAYVVAMANAMPLHVQLPFVITASLCGGAIVGMTSSMLTQYAGLPHLLSSIITFGIFYGVTQLMAGSYISLSAYNNPLIVGGVERHPELLMFLCIAAIVSFCVYFLCKKQLGFSFAIYGNNPYFFKHYGVSVPYIFITGVMVSNGLAGLSGYLFAQSNGFADITMGFGKALLCITALILGKVIIRPIKPIVITMPLIGCAAYFTLQQLLLKAGFNLKYFTTVQAIVTLFILISMYRQQVKQRIDHLGV
jgi:putative tryptophan/tyrosine transport system permease protein